MAVKKQKKLSGVIKNKKPKKKKIAKPLPDTVEDGLPGKEDVLLDQVSVKPHPDYPDFD
jgi:hypothetical protein